MADPRDLRTPDQVLADAAAAGVDLAAVDRQLRLTVEQRLVLLDFQVEVRRRVRRPGLPAGLSH